jgi:hypothetical protein
MSPKVVTVITKTKMPYGVLFLRKRSEDLWGTSVVLLRFLLWHTARPRARRDKPAPPRSWVRAALEALLPEVMDADKYRQLVRIIAQQQKTIGLTQVAVARAMGRNAVFIAAVEMVPVGSTLLGSAP